MAKPKVIPLSRGKPVEPDRVLAVIRDALRAAREEQISGKR